MKQLVVALIMSSASFSTGSDSAAKPAVAPFGSWRSPITTQMLVAGAVRFGDVTTDGDTVYWVEGRPEEQGRYVIVPAHSRRQDRGRAAEAVQRTHDGPRIWWRRDDRRRRHGVLHELRRPAVVAARCRAANRSRSRPNRSCGLRISSSTLPAIGSSPCARITRKNDHEPANRIVAVNLADGKVTTLVEGADFYSNPRVSPDGTQLAWLAWNHPNMPWDDTELFVASIASDGSIGQPRKVAGGEDESIFQPSWSPDGTLYFVSDRTDWWNLYAERDGKIVAHAADGGRVRRAAVGVRHADVRLSARWHDHRSLFARRQMERDAD